MERCMRRWKIWTAVLLAAALIGGCGVREAFSNGKKGEKEYGKGETMMIVTTERLRYEELYSDQIWNAAVDNRGTTFESVLLTQIHDFLKELRVMSLMAKEQGIELTSREKELVKEAAKQYYTALGGTDAAKFDLDEKTIEAFYTDYWIAEKLVEKLTEGINLEVSDSEAKVITVTQIELDDLAEATEVLAKVQEEGSDFSSLAKEYSTDSETEKQIFRGLHGSEYEEAAFRLATGEISGILSDSGKYYILKCVSDYDESATKVRKEQMMRQKKNEAFYGSYQTYKDEMELTEDPALWQEITIAGSPKVMADFYEIYEKVCVGETAQ